MMVRLLLAGTIGWAVWWLVLGPPSARLADRVRPYLVTGRPAPRDERAIPRWEQAGLSWTRAEFAARLVLAAAGGALAGLIMGQTRGPSSVPILGLLGSIAGALAFRAWLSTRIQRRKAALFDELPSVTDILALQLVAGESVASALEGFVESGQGVMADELREILSAYRNGEDLGKSLVGKARSSLHPEAGRLYQHLAQAHHSGGRQGAHLARLAADFRAAATRALTVEGGRRALAVYGPIIALMIPVTVLFLMFPTIVGLRQLAAGP